MMNDSFDKNIYFKQLNRRIKSIIVSDYKLL